VTIWFRKVSPLIWDDELMVSADDLTRIVWVALLTGPQVTNLPGLMIGDALLFASFLRRPESKITTIFESLQQLGRIEVDSTLRVIRVVNAPRYNPPRTTNWVLAWYKVWNDLPNSTLKHNHLPSLRSSVVNSKWAIVQAWNSTFGRVRDDLWIGQRQPETGVSIESRLNRDSMGNSTPDQTAKIRDQRSEILRSDQRESDPFRTSAEEDPDGPRSDRTPGTQLSIAGCAPDLTETVSAAVDEVWKHYLAGWVRHVRTGRRPVLDHPRSTMIEQALRNFRAGELKDAVSAFFEHGWHVQNGYTDIKYVLCDASHIERFLGPKQATTPPPARTTIAPPGPTPRLGTWVADSECPPPPPLMGVKSKGDA
jgi:hypothetical protein